MLTSFADDEALFASIMAGAAGYVLKQIRGGELVERHPRVAAGDSLLDRPSPRGCSTACGTPNRRRRIRSPN